MENSSSDSSDSGLFQNKKKSPITKGKVRIEEKSSRGEGIVDVNSPKKKKKSLVKQSIVSPESIRKTNELDKFDDSDTVEKGENSEPENHVNIKQENFSSDRENEDPGPTRKSLFNDWDARTTVYSNWEQSKNKRYSDDDSNSNSETVNEYENSPSKSKSESIVKAEVICYNDNEDNFEKSNTSIYHSELKISPKQEDESSDNDKPLTQIIQTTPEKKKPTKICKTSPSSKNLNESFIDFELDEKESLRKSPPRITKSEIINKKSKKNYQRTIKTENLSTSIKDDSVNGNIDENEKKTLKRKHDFEDSSSNESLIDFGGDKQEVKRSPSKRKESPKKTQSPFKKKQISKTEEFGNNSGVEAAKKMNKKAVPGRNLKSILNGESAAKRLSICDDDTTSEEEKVYIKKKDTSKNYVLGIEKPKNSSKKSSNVKSKQMVLVVKDDDQVLKNNTTKNDKSNPSIKPQSIPNEPSKFNRESTGNLSADSSNEEVPHSAIKECSKKKSKHNNNSDESEVSSKSTVSDKQQTKLPSPTKILDSQDSSNKKKVLSLGSARKTPPKRKISEGNSHEIESNKRAKLSTPLKKSEHNMSDSDDTDSLTKLNTTLNKSMALMENSSEVIRLNKNRKSVSINTKHESKTNIAARKARTQKSILKKPEHDASPDENSISNEEETIEQNVRSINVEPKMIRRPLNFKDLEERDTLTHDTSTKVSFVLEDLSSDDEIYIMDVPRTVDPRELKGQTIRLAGKNKLQIGNQFYETCERNVSNISCVFRTDKNQFSCKTVNIKPAGCIKLRQKVSKPLQIELPPLEKIAVPFPKDLKTRHPLFGAEYEDKITVEKRKFVKKITKSKVRAKSIPKTHETRKDVPENFVDIKREKKSMKSERPKEPEADQIDCSNELAINFKTDPVKTERLCINYSSDSDSYEGFFQTVKRGKKKHKKRKDEQNLSSISNIEKITSMKNLPFDLNDDIDDIEQQNLSLNDTKLESSPNPHTIKRKKFDKFLENNQFSSSTPQKFDKHWSNDEEAEVSSSIFDKRKKDKKKRKEEL